MIARTQTFVVAVYFHDLAYGGPEEGGWYYEYGDLNAIYPEQSFPDRVSACGYRRLLQHALDATENKGRPSISSSRSMGRFQARIYKGEAPQHYPQERPRYE